MSLRAWGIRSRSANTWQSARIGAAAGGSSSRSDSRRAITTLTPLDGAPLEAFAEALAERRNYCRNYREIRTVSLSEGIGWPYPVVPNCAA